MGNEKRMEKDWLLWGSNLLTRRTTKMLIQDALLTRFEDEKTRQVLCVCVCVCFGIYKLSHRLCSRSAIMWMGGWVLCLQDRVRREFFAKKVEEMLLLRTQQRDLIFEVVGFLISFPHSQNSLQILHS